MSPRSITAWGCSCAPIGPRWPPTRSLALVAIGDSSRRRGALVLNVGSRSKIWRWTVEDWKVLNDYLDACVDHLRERHGVDKINILGICQGGTLSTCYSALHPDKVANLILTVTPIDFHAGQDELNPEIGLLFNWGKGVDVDLMVDAYGNVPADVLNFTFLMVKPFALNFGKYHDMLDMLDDERAMMNFLRMEKSAPALIRIFSWLGGSCTTTRLGSSMTTRSLPGARSRFESSSRPIRAFRTISTSI